MSSCIFSAVVSQDVAEMSSLVLEICPLFSSGVVSNACSQALTNSLCVPATETTSPYNSITSTIAVLTTGNPAAMYSRILSRLAE